VRGFLVLGLLVPFVAACSGIREVPTLPTSPSSTSTSPTATCAYAITTTTFNMASAGGSATIGVTTGSTCAWSATSNGAFVSVTSPGIQTGSGTVSFMVLPNGGSARNATLSIAGQSVSVSQAAGGVDAALGNWSGTISKGAGCPAILPASLPWTGTIRQGAGGNAELVVSIPGAGVVNQALGLTIIGNTVQFGVPLDTNYAFVGTLGSDRRSVDGTFTGAACSGTWNATHQ